MIKFKFDPKKIYDFFKNNSFGIINSFYNTPQEKVLKDFLKGYGWHELKGMWKKEYFSKVEYALFIPLIKKEDIFYLGIKFNEPIIYAYNDKILVYNDNEISTYSDFKDALEKWAFYKNSEYKNVTLDMTEPKVINNYITALMMETYKDNKSILEYIKDIDIKINNRSLP